MAGRPQRDSKIGPSAATNENGPTTVTIAVPTSGGWTFEAELVTDESGVLMLYEPSRAKRRAFCQLAAVLKIGWRIVAASSEEQAILDAHGFASGWVQ
jgi:hypothetical protein